MKTDLDIVVAVYGHPDLWRRCLNALELFGDHRNQIIIVDDASPDGSGAELELLCKMRGFKFAQHDLNRGPYAAWNTGIALGSSPYVMLIGTDVVVMPDTLDAIHKALKQEDIVSPHEHVAPSPFWEGVNHLSKRHGHQDGIGFSCCAFLRHVYDLVGPFDENFKLTFGDTDWEERTKKLLYKHYRLPNWVHHGGSVTRKRGGLDRDVSNNVQDHRLFCQLWSSEPEVLKKHGFCPPEVQRIGTAQSWSRGEK